MYDFNDEFAETYKEECSSCGREIQVSTQKDEESEYYTYVYVRCVCGNSVFFRLPVN